jgi:hypothetical protein
VVGGNLEQRPDQRVRELETGVAQLRREQAKNQRVLDALQELLVLGLDREAAFQRKVSSRVSQIERSTRDTEALLPQIVNSQIWKILKAGAGLMLSAMNLVNGRRSNRPSHLPGQKKAY